MIKTAARKNDGSVRQLGADELDVVTGGTQQITPGCRNPFQGSGYPVLIPPKTAQ